MKLDIAKDDMFWIRSGIEEAVRSMKFCPNPSSWSKTPEVMKKLYAKITKALEKGKPKGHSCPADWCMPEKKPPTTSAQNKIENHPRQTRNRKPPTL